MRGRLRSNRWPALSWAAGRGGLDRWRSKVVAGHGGLTAEPVDWLKGSCVSGWRWKRAVAGRRRPGDTGRHKVDRSVCPCLVYGQGDFWASGSFAWGGGAPSRPGRWSRPGK